MAIVVAAGGAALGTALGVGPNAGWLVGAAVGNLLFPASGQDSRVEGPRLGDLTVTSSAYGAPVAIAYGTIRLAGNLIWSSGISERQNVSRTRAGGKGGGGATQTAVSYAYYASLPIAFAEGAAEDVLRIWADGKLLYDKSGASPEVAKGGLRFRFHPGSENQLPDPLIEAHVGEGRAPAHRGLCTIVFEDLPLADVGNRIPNLTAEITFHRTVAQPYQLVDLITTGEGGGRSPATRPTASRSTGVGAMAGSCAAVSIPPLLACAVSICEPCARTARRGSAMSPPPRRTTSRLRCSAAPTAISTSRSAPAIPSR
jgi:hypothetical protein